MRHPLLRVYALLAFAYLMGACDGGTQGQQIDTGDETTSSDQALTAVTLTVKSRSIESGGAEFTGMWMQIFQNGKLVKSGFTRLVASLNPGTYTVTVANFQNVDASQLLAGVILQNHDRAVLCKRQRHVQGPALFAG